MNAANLVDQSRQRALQLDRQVDFVTTLRVKLRHADRQASQILDAEPSFSRHQNARLKEDRALLDTDS